MTQEEIKTEKPVKPARIPFPEAIIVDTREQQPYTFAGIKADVKDGSGILTIATVRRTLQTGDYAIDGHEGEIAVERKSFNDFYSTLASGRDRFEAELKRLAVMPFGAIIVEAEWSEILQGHPRTLLSPKSVHRSVIAWQQRYPSIHWWFLAERRLAEITTFRIFERFLRERAAK
jgi:ERCC4-type nuclease